MHVEISPTAPEDWDRFVEAHASATAYHRAAAVSIGARAFGLRTSFLTARDSSGQLCGVLPLIEQSSFLFGRFLVSVPFFTYGGILANDEDASQALVARAIEMARERRADHLELRHTAPIPGVKLAERLEKVSMVLPLPASEKDLSAQLGSKLRSQIRRAERESPEVIWGGPELIGDFYRVFASTMHALGTPVYARRFFDVVYEAMAGSIACLTVRVRGGVQAAAIVVHHRDRIEVPWAAALPEAKRTAVNMRMYWELLCYAIRVGAARFDFGRSTVDSGTYRFKAQWGAKPMQLHWHYWLPREAPIPRINHSNPRYALAASLWRRMPLVCANTIGPLIARHLP